MVSNRFPGFVWLSFVLVLIPDVSVSWNVNVNTNEDHGPILVKQPAHTTFDTSKTGPYSEVTLSCFAVGKPTPTYKWFLEDYQNDRLVEREIDPLVNDKYMISGGNLIIRNPQQRLDQGIYHCKASNKYGTVISESASLNFGYVFEFNYNRSAESGNLNWGKLISCDQPSYSLKVRFNWARDFFPNFVEEDRRVFVSFDGTLLFSSLELVDRGNYSCSVRSESSDVGKNGPFFPLQIHSHSNYQKLYFPNNFPKVFPDAPVADEDLRLECVAFGYPVPSYNWSRSEGQRLPIGSQILNYGRVLLIPKAKIEDQGTYICNAFNDRSSIQNNVTIRIQSEPKFLQDLEDKFVDKNNDVLWSCLAFGIPDVNYTWYKNGKRISQDPADEDYNERYVIDNNMLSIKYVEPEVDAGMYQCRAQNQLKEKYQMAQLFAKAIPPTFENTLLKHEILAPENGFVELTCKPFATPVLRYQWRKNDLVVSSSLLGGRGFVSAQNGSLVLQSVKRDDEGLYKCIASNNYGSSAMYVMLIVRESPRLKQALPPSVVLEYRAQLDLDCDAETTSLDLDLAYYWYHNNISIGTNDRMLVIDGYLSVQNMTFLDSGVYKCEIVTAVGKISSETMVTVLGPPGPPGGLVVSKITTNSVTLQWTDGAANGYIILYYVVEGRIKGAKNEWHVIAEFGADRVQNVERNLRQITLENVLSPWCTYEFVISAVNELGKGVQSLPSPKYTTSASKPDSFPENIAGAGGKIGDLTITWDPLPINKQHGPGIYYIVSWKRAAENQFKKLSLKEFGNTGVAIIQIPAEFFYTKYDVKLQAANMYGLGPESNVVTVYSAEDMPQVAPQTVFAERFNSTALNVTWRPVLEKRETLRGKLIGYRVKYWKKEDKEEDAIYYLSRNTRPWSLIVGLQPNVFYLVKVLAYNSAGEGPESERFLQRTYRKAPQKPPSSVIIKGINPSAVEVTWRYVSPSEDEEPLIGYKIRIWKSDEDISRAFDTTVMVGSDLRAIVDNLTPGISYNLRALAFSNGGEGRLSSPTLTFKTA